MEPSFDFPTKAEWLSRVERDLKGRPLESLDFTVANRTYSPFHHLSDRKTTYPPIPGMPQGPRAIGIEIDASKDVSLANTIALDALSKGANLLFFRVPSGTELSKGDRKKLLKDIFTDIVTITYGEPVYQSPDAPLVIRSGDQYEVDALGGDMADGLYTAMESYVEDGLHRPTFHVPVLSNYLQAIATLRALRLCWGHISEACGGRTGCRVVAHVRFSAGSDANDNKISGTTRAMSAIIGGADGIIMAASDHDPNNGFSRRVALNLLHVLAYESHLDATADTAAGSYYLEQLTTDIASDLYARFQKLTTDPSYTI